MGGGAQGPSSSSGAHFLVCSYTDIDVLAHLPKGDVATEANVTSVRVSEHGHITVGAGVRVPGPNPAFCLKHPQLPTFYVSTECIHEDGEIYTLQMGADGTFHVTGKQTSVRRMSARFRSHDVSQPLFSGWSPGAAVGRHSSPIAQTLHVPIGPQGGKSTCFLQLDQQLRNLIAVSYWDAKVSTLAVREGGALDSPRFIMQTPGAEYVQKTVPGRIEHWTYRQRC